MSKGEDHPWVTYALRFGPRCRDCADEDGVCPASGLACEVSAAIKSIEHVARAIRYGLKHGYIDA